MTLKSARIARAEDLTAEERAAAGIHIERGLIVLELHNEELHEKGVPLGAGGFREYLLNLGDFNEVDIEEEDI